jgi:hypothetical protein
MTTFRLTFVNLAACAFCPGLGRVHRHGEQIVCYVAHVASFVPLFFCWAMTVAFMHGESGPDNSLLQGVSCAVGSAPLLEQ